MKTMVFCIVLLYALPTSNNAGIIVPKGVDVEVYSSNVPNPKELAFDSQGNLYVANDGNSNVKIYKISQEGSIVEFFGPTLSDPDCVAVDQDDNVFIGSETGCLYRVSPDGTSSCFSTNYMGNNCSMVIDSNGIFGIENDIFVGNARATCDIARINSDGVGTPFISSSKLHIPFGLAFDDSQYLYIAEASEEVVGIKGLYRATKDGTMSFWIYFNSPFSIAFNKAERNLYVGDIEDNRIYKVSLDGIVWIFARDVIPWGLTFGTDGSLYVADHSTIPHRILKITGSGELMPCDYDVNGYVNLDDLSIIASAWLSIPSNTNWNFVCDDSIPADNCVDLSDFSGCSSNWQIGLK